MIAYVAIAIPHSDPFDYIVPEEMKALITPGDRVLVPFNRRTVIGIVVAIKKESEFDRLKVIDFIVDKNPIFDRRILEFTHWISQYYSCSWGEVLEAAVPTGLKPKLAKSYSINLDHEAYRALEESEQTWLLQTIGKTEHEVSKFPDYEQNKQLLKNALLEKLVIWKFSAIIKSESQNLIDSYSLSPNYNELITTRKGSKTDQLINLLKDSPGQSKKNMLSLFPGSRPSISGLLKKGALIKKLVEVSSHKKKIRVRHDKFFRLNKQQTEASEEINLAIRSESYQTFLLFGVTGSGKTEVYLCAVREALSSNKTSLILLPEISLTPQAVRRFKDRFGEQVAVLHSGMTEKVRCQEWWKIKNNTCPIVIGARSAIFAPLTNIGLIVVDEEHDSSYKQQETPYYNARDAAVKMGADYNAVVVLGSATPSVESYYNCEKEKYKLLELSQRASQKPLPSAEIVDLKSEIRQPGVFYLSKLLVKRLRENYENEKQALIFLNRRGFASFVACINCDAAVLCRNCSIAMTWHKKTTELICHHCGFSHGYPTQCPHCYDKRFKLEGIGTERVERDLNAIFPQGRFIRIDRDTIAQRGSLEKSMRLINDHKADFVVGTQLISKGHDFKNIGLVCVILADMTLNIPDFRSSERGFQLISQVAGRAGRDKEGKGFALIQAYNPTHYAVVSANDHDYLSFYQRETQERKQMRNPPYIRQILIRLSELNPLNVELSAKTMGEHLSKQSSALDFEMMGPVEAPIQKINNRFYWQILIKSTCIANVKKYLRDLLWVKKDWKPKGKTRVSIDVDPYVML